MRRRRKKRSVEREAQLAALAAMIVAAAAEYTTRVVTLSAAPTLPSSLPRDWALIVSDLLVAIAEVAPGFVVQQVSQKFGGLRVILDPHTIPPEVRPHVLLLKHEATVRSLATCDVCGGPGFLTESGWLRTRCEEHRSAETVEAVLVWPEGDTWSGFALVPRSI